MNGLYEAASQIQRFFEEQGWRFCIIGGIAVIRWGQPRATQDVDVSLLTGLGDEEQYIDPILQEFASRIPDPNEFAIQSRVLLIEASNGVSIDVALAAFPYEESVIERSSLFRFSGSLQLQTASAEDLIVLKAIAGRHRDWDDIEGIAVRQSGKLDWDQVFARLEELRELVEDPDVLERVEEIRRQSETL
jgi:predicted nucleotidyltransferase